MKFSNACAKTLKRIIATQKKSKDTNEKENTKAKVATVWRWCGEEFFDVEIRPVCTHSRERRMNSVVQGKWCNVKCSNVSLADGTEKEWLRTLTAPGDDGSSKGGEQSASSSSHENHTFHTRKPWSDNSISLFTESRYEIAACCFCQHNIYFKHTTWNNIQGLHSHRKAQLAKTTSRRISLN